MIASKEYEKESKRGYQRSNHRWQFRDKRVIELEISRELIMKVKFIINNIIIHTYK